MFRARASSLWPRPGLSDSRKSPPSQSRRVHILQSISQSENRKQSSRGNLEIESRRAECDHQANPDWKEHLRSARGCYVSQVDHVLPAEPGVEQSCDFRLGGCIVSADE